MKKYLVISISLLAMMTFAGSAFALETIDPSNTTTIAGAVFTPSTGVTLKVIATPTAYAAQSKHLSGNKLFGTLSTDSDISTATGVVGNVIAAPTSATELNLADAPGA